MQLLYCIIIALPEFCISPSLESTLYDLQTRPDTHTRSVSVSGEGFDDHGTRHTPASNVCQFDLPPRGGNGRGNLGSGAVCGKGGGHTHSRTCDQLVVVIVVGLFSHRKCARVCVVLNIFVSFEYFYFHRCRFEFFLPGGKVLCLA